MISYGKNEFYEIKLSCSNDINSELAEKISKINSIISDKLKNHSKQPKNNVNDNWRKTRPKFSKNFNCEEEGLINSNLNKISPKNFTKIAENIIELINKNPKVLSLAIENIFKKAVNQPIYCEYYVKLFTIFIDRGFEIQNLINEKCLLFTQLLEYRLSSPDKANFDYDEFCKTIKEKQYKNGFSQFVGELANYSLIDISIIHDNISIFIKNLDEKIKEDPKNDFIEDNILCLNKILITCKDKLDNKDELLQKLDFFKDSGIIIRLKFKLMDLIDELKK